MHGRKRPESDRVLRRPSGRGACTGSKKKSSYIMELKEEFDRRTDTKIRPEHDMKTETNVSSCCAGIYDEEHARIQQKYSCITEPSILHAAHRSRPNIMELKEEFDRRHDTWCNKKTYHTVVRQKQSRLTHLNAKNRTVTVPPFTTHVLDSARAMAKPAANYGHKFE